MTKDEIYREIRDGRRWRWANLQKNQDIWRNYEDLQTTRATAFYEEEVELEPIPERTFTISQIKKSWDMAVPLGQNFPITWSNFKGYLCR